MVPTTTMALKKRPPRSVPDPPAAAEPVGLGDVGVEGREERGTCRSRSLRRAPPWGRRHDRIRGSGRKGTAMANDEQQQARAAGRPRRSPRPAPCGRAPTSSPGHEARAAPATTTSGWNSRANGAVSRRVRSGSVTAYLNRSASSGLDRCDAPADDPSAATSSPSGRSCSSTSVRTLSLETVRAVGRADRGSATSS